MVYLVSEYQDKALELTVEKAPKLTTARIKFIDNDTREVVAEGKYDVNLDGDATFNVADVNKFVPEGYKKLEGVMVYLVSEYQDKALELTVEKAPKLTSALIKFIDNDTREV